MKRGKPTNRLLDRYIGIPVLNLLTLFHHRRKRPETVNRIGVLVNPALGDTMLASAAVRDLREQFPRAKLIFFAARSNVAVARMMPEIDVLEVIPLTRPWKAIRQMREAGLDLLVDFTSWQRLTAMISYFSGARFRVGFERAAQHRHRGYDVAVPHLGSCHELENLRRMTAMLGVREHQRPGLAVPDQSVDTAFAGKRLVVFHAWASGALNVLREWPEENWVELARHLESPDRLFVLTGGPGDRERCEQFQRRLEQAGVAARVLIGSRGLEEVAAVLQRAELLVSVNTGIMHLGAILGTPTVALNGPNSPKRWGPVGERVANVDTCDGSGGFLDLGFEFDGHYVMDRIRPESVVEAVEWLKWASGESRRTCESDLRIG